MMKKRTALFIAMSIVLSIAIGILSYVFFSDNLLIISKEEKNELSDMYLTNNAMYIDGLSLINVADEASLKPLEEHVRKLDDKMIIITRKSKYRAYSVYHEEIALSLYRAIQIKKDLIKVGNVSNEKIFPIIDHVYETLEKEKKYISRILHLK